VHAQFCCETQTGLGGIFHCTIAPGTLSFQKVWNCGWITCLANYAQWKFCQKWPTTFSYCNNLDSFI